MLDNRRYNKDFTETFTFFFLLQKENIVLPDLFHEGIFEKEPVHLN